MLKQAAVEAANADLSGDISRLQISAHACGGQISEHPSEITIETRRQAVIVQTGADSATKPAPDPCLPRLSILTGVSGLAAKVAMFQGARLAWTGRGNGGDS
jgi:hypothetical protein